MTSTSLLNFAFPAALAQARQLFVALAQANRIAAPGHEGVGTGLVPQAPLAMTSREPGIGAFLPRRKEFCVLGTSLFLAGKGRGPVRSRVRFPALFFRRALAQANRLAAPRFGKSIDGLKQGGARLVVGEACHGASMCPAHARCHGAGRGRAAP